MSLKEDFIEEIQHSYKYKGDKIVLGKAKLEGEVLEDAEISVAMKTLNRHGLIAGATGTGKTKSLQILAEHLSLKGVPTLLMDVKGDLSGIAEPGTFDTAIQERQKHLGLDYEPSGTPIEFLSLSDEKGVRLRATVEEFGPVLFSKILGLNETQSSIISIVYKYCEDNNIPLNTLEDMQKVLQYVGDKNGGRTEFMADYGNITSASLGAILRNTVTLQQQGGSLFFGEPSFDIHDLLQMKSDGRGVASIIRLTDIQDRPALFSTFMLSLLSKVYNNMPEAGDLDKPKLVIFIDEAHLVFKEASKTLLARIESIIKLIRSKGVGVIFCTQLPGDIPDAVLSQLGLKIQHALRGFTAKDRKEIQKAVENYPITRFYKADEVITQLGIGEAFVTALNEKGVPTSMAHTYMRAPLSRMDVLTEQEIDEKIQESVLIPKYASLKDDRTAEEVIEGIKKEKQGNAVLHKASDRKSAPATQQPTGGSRAPAQRTRRKQSVMGSIFSAATLRSYARTIGNEIIRRFFKKLPK